MAAVGRLCSVPSLDALSWSRGGAYYYVLTALTIGYGTFVPATANGTLWADSSQWHVPEYCSTPEQMKMRGIELLPEGLASKLKLLQVQAVVRHGARVPYMKMYCWHGEAPYNCNLNTIVAAQTSNHADNVHVRRAPRFYRKLYDWNTTADPFGNEYPGTCLVGQLVTQGIDQHHANGRHLRAAYLGPLFGGAEALAGGLPAMEADYLLRSDDMQRTILSGQALFDGFFPPAEASPAGAHAVNWHTRDLSRSTLYPNKALCPRLGVVGSAGERTAAFNALNNSAALVALTSAWLRIAGPRFEWRRAFDCIMEARCNGRPLPHGITEKMFNESVAYYESWNKINYNYNNAAFSKLAMRPLIREIRDQMLHTPVRRKFVLHSGHDTTVLPLMSALGGSVFDGHWPHYAHMVVFELYAGVGQDQLHPTHFRILSNGKPVRMEGCATDVCSIETFKTFVDVDLSDAKLGGCSLTVLEKAQQVASTQTVSLPLALGGAVLCSALRSGVARANLAL
jgi:hypothetical protein